MSVEVQGSATCSKQIKCEAPQVSTDDLSAFHQSHFGDGALGQFGHTFLNPAAGAQIEEAQPEDTPEENWDEEDLGYYDDGVQRTLTDDQIAMFRHSELKELRRKQEKAALRKHKQEDSDGSQQDDAPPEESALPSQFKTTKKRKKNHRPKERPKEPKPDLRKRTWDVVEKGLDSLDYD